MIVSVRALFMCSYIGRTQGRVGMPPFDIIWVTCVKFCPHEHESRVKHWKAGHLH